MYPSATMQAPQKIVKKTVLFLTPTSSTPFAPLPLSPVPPTPRPSPTESDVSLPSSSCSTASYESSAPSTPPLPIIESEYYAPEPPQPIQVQVPSIHYILSAPSFDLALPLPALLSRIPAEHLNQAATSPPIASLFITSPLMPWFVHVAPGAVPQSPQTPAYSTVLPCTPASINARPPPPAYSYNASPPTAAASISPADDDEYYLPPDAVAPYITVCDIITAFHSSMHSHIKPLEFSKFSDAAKDCVARSYHSRVALLDERAMRKSKKKGAVRMDVLPLGHTRVAGFFVGSWDPEKREAAWGVEFGLS